MKPHNYSAPGLTGHHVRVIKRKPHVAIWRGNDLIRCSCGKPLEDEVGYRQHLNTRASYGDQHLKGKK